MNPDKGHVGILAVCLVDLVISEYMLKEIAFYIAFEEVNSKNSEDIFERTKYQGESCSTGYWISL